MAADRGTSSSDRYFDTELGVQLSATGPDLFAPTFSSAIADARKYMDWIVTTMRPYLGSNLLEVGVGHGSYCEYFKEIAAYRGIDIDPQNVASSRAKYPGATFEIGDVCSDQFNSTFVPGSVDTIVCCNVIEHIEDDSRAVVNMANALSRGGHLFILVPALQMLYGELDRLAGHCRRYDKPQMLKACSSAPVEILELRYFNPIGGLAWWLNRYVSHKSLDDAAVNAQIRIFDKYVLPVSRLIDPLTRSFFGQSLICVARKL
jgi:SAM-dependent methyltransferase